MTKIFSCDNCGKQFPSPLDEEKITDEHGVTYTLDLCAPCRKLLGEKKQKVHQDFLKEVLKKKNG